MKLVVSEAEEAAPVGFFVGMVLREHEPWELTREIGWGFGG